MNIANKEEIKVHTLESIGNIQIIEDWIYYYEGTKEDLRLYRMKTDGSKEQLIH